VAARAAFIALVTSGTAGLIVAASAFGDVSVREHRHLLYVSVVAGAATLTATALGTWWVVDRLLAERLRRFTGAVLSAARGRYPVGAHSAAPDELGDLSRAFDSLVTEVTDLSVQQIESGRELEWTRRELRLKNAVALLFELTQTLTTETDIDTVLRTLCARVAPALGVAEMAILRYDERSGQLTVRATAGFEAEQDPLGVTFSASEGLVGLVATSGTPLYIADTSVDERYLYFKGKHRVDGSFACLPLKLPGRLVGVLTLLRRGVAQFAETDRHVLESLASSTTLAVAHAEMTARLSELATTDELTQVANRRLLMDRLGRELERARRTDKPLAVLMADLDHFKRVNDEYGHLRGDEVLRLVAHELGAHLRRMDTVGRYGGEEFVILVPDTPREQGQVVAEKLRQSIAALSFPDGLTLTISIGVAVFPSDADDPAGIIDAADRALLAAKRRGRNQVALYEPESVSGAARLR
jgi:diguanylate cyclase (GGDEF)-like protein